MRWSCHNVIWQIIAWMLILSLMPQMLMGFKLMHLTHRVSTSTYKQLIGDEGEDFSLMRWKKKRKSWQSCSQTVLMSMWSGTNGRNTLARESTARFFHQRGLRNMIILHFLQQFLIGGSSSRPKTCLFCHSNINYKQPISNAMVYYF